MKIWSMLAACFHDAFTVLQREFRDFMGYWLLPALACLLPWKLCWRLYRKAARRHWLYPEESHAMQQGLARLQPEADTRQWLERFKLAWLLEQADLFLFRFQPQRNLRSRWQEPDGRWPRQRPFMTLFFNFGFGLLVLEQMRAAGLQPSLVYAPVPAERPGGMSRSRYAYMRFRQQAMQRACEQRAIPTGGAWEKIQQALAEQRSIVVVADAPSKPGNRTIPVRLFGHQGQWRRGVVDLVTQAGLPTVLFRVRLNWETGVRQLVISPPLDCRNEQALIEDLLHHFHRGMEEHPETWLYWTALEAFLPALHHAPSGKQSSTMAANPERAE